MIDQPQHSSSVQPQQVISPLKLEHGAAASVNTGQSAMLEIIRSLAIVTMGTIVIFAGIFVLFAA